MNIYNSILTRTDEEALDSRITNLENQIITLQNLIASIKTNYITKEQLNSLTTTQQNSYIGISSLIYDNSTTWRSFMSSFTPNVNGYLNVYFTPGAGTTTSFYLATSGGMQYRGNGNGSRDIDAIIPVASGQTVTGECVCCHPLWIRFYPTKMV